MPLEWIGQILEWVDNLPFPFNIIVRLVVFGGASAYVLWRAVKIVPQGQMALKLRFGKIIRYRKDNEAKGYVAGVAKHYRPGRIYLLIPEVDKFEMVSVLDRTVEFPEKPIDVANYRQLKVEGNANYKAEDIEFIRYRVEDLEPWTRGATQDVLRQCVRDEWRGVNSPAYQARVKNAFASRIDEVVGYVGLRLQALHITNLAENDQMAVARAISEASGGMVADPSLSDEDFPLSMDPRIVGAMQVDVADVQPDDWEQFESASDVEAFRSRRRRRLRRGQKFGDTGERL